MYMYQDKSCLTFQDTSTYPQKQIMYNNHTKRDFMRKSNKSYRFFNKSLFLNQRIFAMVNGELRPLRQYGANTHAHRHISALKYHIPGYEMATIVIKHMRIEQDDEK